jgi:hypothetical protein
MARTPYRSVIAAPIAELFHGNLRHPPRELGYSLSSSLFDLRYDRAGHASFARDFCAAPAHFYQQFFAGVVDKRYLFQDQSKLPIIRLRAMPRVSQLRDPGPGKPTFKLQSRGRSLRMRCNP